MKSGSLTKLSDTQLLNLIAKGNQMAFSEIYERYWESLLHAAAKVLKDKTAAQDAVQEVFIDIWRKRSSISIENVPAYFHKAIQYKVISQIRKARLPLAKLDFVHHFLETNDTEEALHFNELTTILENAIDQLPDKCGTVFRMSRYEQLSNKEIAEKLDLSVRTVDNHIGNALKNLRYALKGAVGLVLTLIHL